MDCLGDQVVLGSEAPRLCRPDRRVARHVATSRGDSVARDIGSWVKADHEAVETRFDPSDSKQHISEQLVGIQCRRREMLDLGPVSVWLRVMLVCDPVGCEMRMVGPAAGSVVVRRTLFL